MDALLLLVFFLAGVFAVLWLYERGEKTKLRIAAQRAEASAALAWQQGQTYVTQVHKHAQQAIGQVEDMAHKAVSNAERGHAKAIAEKERDDARALNVLQDAHARELAARERDLAAKEKEHVKAVRAFREASQVADELAEKVRSVRGQRLSAEEELGSEIDGLNAALKQGKAVVKAAEKERDRALADLDAIAERYIDDAHKWLLSRVTADNLETTRTKFERVWSFCKKKGYVVQAQALLLFENEFKTARKDAVRKDKAREEQQRVREQIRDEQRAARDIERAQAQAKHDEEKIQAALTIALTKADAEHSAEVAGLRAQLEALVEKKRALSLAQQTRAGHIYVISNVGSFGDGVFKVGMTRRLDPQDRVDELGDASVPFPFDVHMMISCDDAPKLENTLHRELHMVRLNKVNLRKEFFRASIAEIVALVEKAHGKVDYIADAEALDFNETQEIEKRGTFAARFVEASAAEAILEEGEAIN